MNDGNTALNGIVKMKLFPKGHERIFSDFLKINILKVYYLSSSDITS